jgi:dienelactone hydrolase
MKNRFSLLIVSTLLCLATHNTIALAEIVDTLKAGQSGRVEFNSITPPDRHQYARLNLDNTKVQKIYGDVLLPNKISANTKFPAVILSHGSGGVESNSYDVWGKTLTDTGYVVFIPHSYPPRGVKETNSNQSAVPYYAHVADTLYALRLLATHPNVDKNKIYNIGFSRGGSTAFDTAWPTWQRPVDTQGIKFAGHVVFYPGNCNIRYRTDDREKNTAPIFALLPDRELEESADVAICKRHYDQLKAKGNSVRYKEYKGTRHGFDGLNFNYRVNPQTTSSKDCDMEVYMTLARGSGIGKDAFDFKQNKPLMMDGSWATAVANCEKIVPGTRGGMPNGNNLLAEAAQAQSIKDVMNFLEELQNK